MSKSRISPPTSVCSDRAPGYLGSVSAAIHAMAVKSITVVLATTQTPVIDAVTQSTWEKRESETWVRGERVQEEVEDGGWGGGGVGGVEMTRRA